jgi:hypothetical protein
MVAMEDKSPPAAGFRLMPFLRIAQRLGAGASAGSLRDALQRSGYAQSRPSFGAEQVRGVLDAHPALLDAWLEYSESKDTADGWYVVRDAEIGQLSKPASQRQFNSIQEAVAQFIIRELDHHAGLSPHDQPDS